MEQVFGGVWGAMAVVVGALWGLFRGRLCACEQVRHGAWSRRRRGATPFLGMSRTVAIGRWI